MNKNKSTAAAALGKLRWAGSTEEERKAFAAKGGLQRFANLTPERRREIALLGVAARRKKAAKKKKSSSRKSKT